MKRVSELKKTLGPINIVCPRCSDMIPNRDRPGAYPGALSRWDNTTEICSRCGNDEAMIQFEAQHGARNPHAAVHPVTGEQPWDNPPDGA